jgi:hypothetical protein
MNFKELIDYEYACAVGDGFGFLSFIFPFLKMERELALCARGHCKLDVSTSL